MPRDQKIIFNVLLAVATEFLRMKSLQSDLVREDGRFKSREAIAARFRQAGIGDGDTVVSYCHIGQQATVVYFAARLLGRPARLYDGSYEEWAAKPDIPIAR